MMWIGPRIAQSYWFNGVVPNAFILNDSRLKADVQNMMNYVIANQGSDGWLGPAPRYLWGRSVTASSCCFCPTVRTDH